MTVGTGCVLTGSISDPPYSKKSGLGKQLIPSARQSARASYGEAGNRDFKEAVVRKSKYCSQK